MQASIKHHHTSGSSWMSKLEHLSGQRRALMQDEVSRDTLPSDRESIPSSSPSPSPSHPPLTDVRALCMRHRERYGTFPPFSADD